jgi:hypothetical protein
MRNIEDRLPRFIRMSSAQFNNKLKEAETAAIKKILNELVGKVEAAGETIGFVDICAIIDGLMEQYSIDGEA